MSDMFMPPRFFCLLVALMAATWLRPAPATAAELVMFERDGCAWCLRWNREVGSLYEKTDEAKLLPLRRVNLDRSAADPLKLDAPVRFTPTFVVVDDGREIGRITGYLNDDTFWGLLGTMITKLPAKASIVQTGPISTQ